MLASRMTGPLAEVWLHVRPLIKHWSYRVERCACNADITLVPYTKATQPQATWPWLWPSGCLTCPVFCESHSPSGLQPGDSGVCKHQDFQQFYTR
eukprot:s1099_g16.t1